jgi:hypothetical protein
MADSTQRTCECGAVYTRSESMAQTRELNSFECAVCDRTIESWNSAWVPTYRLISGPGQSSDWPKVVHR